LKRLIVTILILTGGLTAAPVFAEPTPTSDLLLPYFEVDLSGFKRTTLFTVTNNDPQRSVDVEMVVHTNWGIPLETVKATLEPKQTRGYNLRDWLRQGELPQPDGALAALAPRRLAHIQSALLGQKSPVDYPRTPTEVVSQVNSAFASGDRATMLAVASSLDQDNNLGCPLN